MNFETSRTLESFQNRVKEWFIKCFSEKKLTDKYEQNKRFLEEALELAQAAGLDYTDVKDLCRYVYNRKAGEVQQEVGGVMISLSSLCTAHGIDINKCREDELARVWRNIDNIRKKDSEKP